jgi:hypothetical protein
MRRIFSNGLAFLIGTQVLDFLLVLLGAAGSFEILGFLGKLLVIVAAIFCVMLLTRFKRSSSELVSLLELWFYFSFGIEINEGIRQLGLAGGLAGSSLLIMLVIAGIVTLFLLLRRFKQNTFTYNLANAVVFIGGLLLVLFPWPIIPIVRWVMLIFVAVSLLIPVAARYMYTEIKKIPANTVAMPPKKDPTRSSLEALRWCRNCGAENTNGSFVCSNCNQQVEGKTFLHRYTKESPAVGHFMGGADDDSLAPARTWNGLKYLAYREIKNDDQLESTRASIERNFVWGIVRLRERHWEAWVEGVSKGNGTRVEAIQILDNARDGKRPETQFLYYQPPMSR